MIQIIFLGTGGTIPLPERALLSVALVREGEILLFDCPEGTQVQFRKAGLRPAKLRRILITHLHADHIAGLVGFLLTLQLSGLTGPIEIYGPPGTERLINTTARLMLSKILLDLQIHELEGTGVINADGYEIRHTLLDHLVPTFGYALVEPPRPGKFLVEEAQRLGVPEGPLWGQLQRGQPVVLEGGRVVYPWQVLGPPRSGRRIAFITDTRPCESELFLAEKANVFIREASFTETLVEEAQLRGHSTARQSAEIALKAGVERLILTHITPRYPNPLPLLEEAREVFPKAELSEDLMVVSVPYPD